MGGVGAKLKSSPGATDSDLMACCIVPETARPLTTSGFGPLTERAENRDIPLGALLTICDIEEVDKGVRGGEGGRGIETAVSPMELVGSLLESVGLLAWSGYPTGSSCSGTVERDVESGTGPAVSGKRSSSVVQCSWDVPCFGDMGDTRVIGVRGRMDIIPSPHSGSSRTGRAVSIVLGQYVSCNCSTDTSRANDGASVRKETRIDRVVVSQGLKRGGSCDVCIVDSPSRLLNDPYMPYSAMHRSPNAAVRLLQLIVLLSRYASDNQGTTKDSMSSCFFLITGPRGTSPRPSDHRHSSKNLPGVDS